MKTSVLYDDVDLLDIQAVTSLPGVRQSTSPLPTPYLDYSKYAPRDCRTSHQYWLRGDIKRWLECQNIKRRYHATVS